MKKQLNLFFGFLFTCLLVQAQQQENYKMNIRHVSIEDGLSHRSVECFHQDHSGFMWIGTKHGLNKFDGYNFRWWTKEKQGLSNNTITQIVEDQEGYLWVINHTRSKDQKKIESIDLLHTETEELLTFEEKFQHDSPFHLENIRNIFQLGNYHIGLETKDNQIWQYGPGNEISKVQIPSGFRLRGSCSANEVWGVKDSVVYTYHLKNKVFRKIINKPGICSAVTGDENGNYWFIQNYAAPEMHKVVFSPGQEPKSVLAFDQVNRLLYNPVDQTIWLADHKKIKIYNKYHELLYNFDFESAKLKNPATEIIRFDRQGLAWVNSSDGFYMLQFKPIHFNRYLNLDSKVIHNSHIYSCRGLWETEASILANTQHGRIRINKKDKSITPLEFLKTKKKEQQLTHRFPFYEDPSGKLWTGAQSLIQLDPRTGEEIKQIHSEQPLRLWSILQDRNAVFWLGDQNGLYFWDPKLPHADIQAFTKFNGFDELANASVFYFQEVNEKEFLLATNKGIFSLHIEKGIQARYWVGGEQSDHLPTDNIQYIYKDKQEIYWLGTEGEGLLKWNRRAGTFQQFSRDFGMPNQNIYAIFEDEFNHLWLSSDYGIVQFNKQNNTFKSYKLREGISSNEFNRGSYYQNKNGRIYFGSVNGITAFDPIDFYKPSAHPKSPLLITKFEKRSNKEGTVQNKIREFNKLERLELKPAERIISLEVALLDYFDSDKISYSYKLDGIHKSWQEAKGNDIVLSPINFGSATLKIRARKANGQFAADSIELPIFHAPPFIRTSMFNIGAPLLFLFLIWALLKWRTRILQKRQTELKSIVAECNRQIIEDKKIIEKQADELRHLDQLKSRFFANISHELRTPLTLILGPVRQLIKSKNLDQQEKSYVEMVNQNAESLLKNVNEILDFSRLEVGQLILKPEEVALHSLLQKQISIYESFAASKAIQLNFSYQADRTLRLMIDIDKFEKIVNNLLSNALKFTPQKGKISVILKDLSDELQLRVQDTGPGIAEEDLPHIFNRFYQTQQKDKSIYVGTGIGLALSKELSQLLKGNIKAQSKPGEGSTFIFTFPKVKADSISQQVVNQAFVQESLITAPSLSEAPQPLLKESIQEKTPTILLVENNLGMQTYIISLLGKYLVRTASNGEEALDILRQDFRPDLIISNVMMPVMDGFSLLEKLKTDTRFSPIPVIMLTALVTQKNKLEALRIGVDDYMTKPFEKEELLVKIDNLLSHAYGRNFTVDDQPRKKTAKNSPSPTQQKWLEKVEEHCLENIHVKSYTPEQLAVDLAMGPRQFHRKIKQYTGLSPNHYLREIRLHEARYLLERGRYQTVSEVSHAVGFGDQHYFSKIFLDRFGKKPKDMILGTI